MIEPAHDLPVARQAKVLNLSRSSVYYRPRPVSPEDLALMRRIDELHLERPFAGSRMLRDFLQREGVAVGRRHGGDADEAHGDRGDLSAAQLLETRAGP